MAEITLSAAVRSSLLSLQNTTVLINRTQGRLATGLAVASAIDDPIKFFEAKTLSDRATDFDDKKAGIDQGISSLTGPVLRRPGGAGNPRPLPVGSRRRHRGKGGFAPSISRRGVRHGRISGVSGRLRGAGVRAQAPKSRKFTRTKDGADVVASSGALACGASTVKGAGSCRAGGWEAASGAGCAPCGRKATWS